MFHAGEEARRAAQVITAGAITNIPVLLVGPPGSGKTECAMLVAALSTEGSERKVWKQTFSAGTSPATVQGAVNVQSLMQDAEVTVTYIGTPYDPEYRAIILDEISRANQPVADALLNLLDGSQFEKPRVIIATSNTALNAPPDSSHSPWYRERMRALQNRFGLNVYYGNQLSSVGEMFHSRICHHIAKSDPSAYLNNAGNHLGFDVPTIGEIDVFTRVYRSIVLKLEEEVKAGEIPEIIEKIAMQAISNGYDVARGYRILKNMNALAAACSLFERMRKTHRAAWEYARMTGEWGEYQRECLENGDNLASAVRSLSPLGAMALVHAWPYSKKEDAVLWERIVLSCVNDAEHTIFSYVSNLHNLYLRTMRGEKDATEHLNSFLEGKRRYGGSIGDIIHDNPRLVEEPLFCLVAVYQDVLRCIDEATLTGKTDKILAIARKFSLPANDVHEVMESLSPQIAWPPSVEVLRFIREIYTQEAAPLYQNVLTIAALDANARHLDDNAAYRRAMTFIKSREESAGAASVRRKR